ncbi:hypothetical protein ACWIG5_32950 [Streptomyces lydicus]
MAARLGRSFVRIHANSPHTYHGSTVPRRPDRAEPESSRPSGPRQARDMASDQEVAGRRLTCCAKVTR